MGLRKSAMRGSRKFSQRGPTLTTFSFVDDGREDPNTTLSGNHRGPPANAI